MKKRASKSSSAPKTDLRLLRTRKALREGLLSLIQTRSIDDITVRDITSESLVGYNTFFRHYGSKDELVEEIVADEFKQLLERSLPALMEAETKKTALLLCEYVAQNRELWTALLVGGEVHHAGGAAPALRKMLIGFSLQQDVRLPEHEWLPADLGAIFGVGAVLDILSWWLAKPEDYPIEHVAELMDRLVLKPALERRPNSNH